MPHPILTVVDPENGDTETAELTPDRHILLLGKDLVLDGQVHYSNGTRVFTIKKKSQVEAIEGGR